MRQSSHQLYPSMLENMGLVEALSTLVNEFSERCSIDINFSNSGLARRLPMGTERALFRITQEALNNVHKHSGASQAGVNIMYSPQRVRLAISDNGKGFSVAEKSREAIGKGSLGLLSMRERAALIQASFKIDSSPNHGTMILVELKQQD
jgi:signal transduction histidine kinase